jgi:hypothetical protein
MLCAKEHAMPTYKHRQVGTLVLVALGLGVVMTGAIVVQAPPRDATVVVGLVLAILLVCLFLFWSLTVEVTPDRLSVWFGPGLIRRTFRIDDLRNARVVRNPWYYGWGIRLTPSGWLFNVSGFEAVELEFKNNGRFRIGTDEPHQLLSAIQHVLQHAST